MVRQSRPTIDHQPSFGEWLGELFDVLFGIVIPLVLTIAALCILCSVSGYVPSAFGLKALVTIGRADGELTLVAVLAAAVAFASGGIVAGAAAGAGSYVATKVSRLSKAAEKQLCPAFLRRSAGIFLLVLARESAAMATTPTPFASATIPPIKQGSALRWWTAFLRVQITNSANPLDS